MPRYIDRDKFMQNLETDKYGYTDCVKVGIALDKAKTDVRPVVKGEWVQESFINKREEKMFHSPKCSACGSNETFKTKFCPNCGADMRKEREE